MKKTITISDDREITVATMTALANRNIPRKGIDGQFRVDVEFNHDIVIEALKAGGMTEDAQSFADNLEDGVYDTDSDYKKVQKAALEVNGFKTVEKAPGEVMAGAEPAQSTGDTSTPVSV